MPLDKKRDMRYARTEIHQRFFGFCFSGTWQLRDLIYSYYYEWGILRIAIAVQAASAVFVKIRGTVPWKVWFRGYINE